MGTVWQSVKDGSWLSLQRMRGYAGLLLVAYGVFLIGLFATANGHLDSFNRPLGTDFANIWSSGRMVIDGRAADAFDPAIQRPYQQALLGTPPDLFYGWHYPPMFLAVATGLAVFPYLTALVGWLLMTSAVYVGTIQRILPLTRRDAPTLVLLATAYPAVFANVTHGHNGALTAALFGSGLALLPSRPVAAGALLGLLAYKPQYGLLIPIALAVTGQWRAIVSAGATVMATVAASIALFGLDSWVAFITHAAFTKETILEHGAAGWFKLQGVFPAVRMYGGSITAAYGAQLFTIAVVMALTVWLWRSPASHAQKSAGLILATMLATPYAFNYDTVVLGVAIAFLAADGLERGFGACEKSALAALWLMPLASRELTGVTLVPWALLANGLVFALLIAKVRHTYYPARRFAHVG